MKPNSSRDPAGLRRAAEARLKNRRATPGPRTGADLASLQHELQVHQVELELQNESLLKSQAELKTALEGYTDLYDFAPVGYLTLGPDGGIRQVNLTAAKMLGVDRSRLVERRLGQFVCPADRAALTTFLKSVFEGQGRESCEVTLANAAEPPPVVRLEAVAVPSGQECRAVLSDISVHKHDQGLLRRSEERYRNLFEIMVQGVVCQDAAGHIFAANPAAERILGLTLDQMQGRTSVDPGWKAIHEDGSDFPGGTHPSMVALRSGEPVRDVIMGVYHPLADRPVWINVNAIPEFRPGETVPYQVYTTFEDITERKRAEAALRQWAGAFEHCAHGIGLGTPGTNQVVACNPALARMIGCPVETLTGSQAISLYAAEDHERVQRYIAEAERVGQVRFEARMVRVDGTVFPVQMDLVSVRDAEGKPMYNVATAQDISERQAAVKALLESERHFAEMFHASPAAIGISRLRDGQFLDVNEAFERLYGYRREEVIGHTSNELRLWRSTNRARVIAELCEKGRVQDLEISGRCKTGETREFLVAMELIDRAGETCILGILTDITERKRAEDLNRLQHGLALVLGGGSNLQEGLRACLDAAMAATGLDCGGFYLLDEATGALELFSHRGLLPDFVDSAARHEAGSAQTRQVMAGKPIYARFSEMDLALPEVQLREGLRFLAMVPLSHNGRTIGCLNVASHTLEDIPDPLRRALETIAAGAASAIVRLRTEEALQESEERFRQMAERINSVFWVSDPEISRLHYVSPAYEQIWGRTCASLYERPESFLEAVHPEDQARVIGNLRARQTEAPEAFEIEYRIVRRDGSVRWIRNRGFPVQDQVVGLLRMVGIADDITEAKQAEDDLRVHGEQLGALWDRLERLREEERTRMAREVHDVLGQLLTGLKMDISWGERRYAHINDEPLRRSLEEKAGQTSQLVDVMIETVQKISRELRPSVLDNIGLGAALQFEARQFQERTGMACQVSVPSDTFALEPERATGVFRVFQELLTNVARHAQATRVTVALSRTANELTVEVSDNGRGIRVEELSHPQSLGLLGMHERASLLGGRFSLRGEPGAGTTATLTIPTEFTALKPRQP